MPYSGQSVTVAYTDPNATAIDVQYTGAGCGGLLSAQLAGSAYTQSAQVANAGLCQITATVTFATGPQVFQSIFRVQATSIALPAFSNVGADFVPGDSLPAAVSNTGALAVTGVTGPGNLINGAVARPLRSDHRHGNLRQRRECSGRVTQRVGLLHGAGTARQWPVVLRCGARPGLLLDTDLDPAVLERVQAEHAARVTSRRPTRRTRRFPSTYRPSTVRQREPRKPFRRIR